MNYLIVDPDAGASGQFVEFLKCSLAEDTSVRIDTCRTIEQKDLMQLSGTDTCVILEIDIDEQTDGLLLAQQLRDLDENIPIVFCSNTNDYAMQCYDINISYYIQKPVSEAAVRRMMERVKKTCF